MRLFDALIYNADRNIGNRLYTVADWKVHLIDHSRSFRQKKDLLAKFSSRPVKVSRQLHQRLIDLDRDGLEAALEGMISRTRIRYVLKRRDAILEKIAADLERNGEVVVFYDEVESPDP